MYVRRPSRFPPVNITIKSRVLFAVESELWTRIADSAVDIRLNSHETGAFEIVFVIQFESLY